MTEWQPIETAPRDGRVLFFLPDERTKIEAGTLRDNKPFIVGSTFAFDRSTATHWMPLPEPPTT